MHNSGFASCMILQKIRYTPLSIGTGRIQKIYPKAKNIAAITYSATIYEINIAGNNIIPCRYFFSIIIFCQIIKVTIPKKLSTTFILTKQLLEETTQSLKKIISIRKKR